MASKITLAQWPDKPGTKVPSPVISSDQKEEKTITDDNLKDTPISEIQRVQLLAAHTCLGQQYSVNYSVLTRELGERTDLRSILKNREVIMVSYIENMARILGLSFAELLVLSKGIGPERKKEVEEHLKAAHLVYPKKRSSTP